MICSVFVRNQQWLNTRSFIHSVYYGPGSHQALNFRILLNQLEPRGDQGDGGHRQRPLTMKITEINI